MRINLRSFLLLALILAALIGVPLGSGLTAVEPSEAGPALANGPEATPTPTATPDGDNHCQDVTCG